MNGHVVAFEARGEVPDSHTVWRVAVRYDDDLQLRGSSAGSSFNYNSWICARTL